MNTWISHLAGWSEGESLLREELNQSREEGKDPLSIERIEKESKDLANSQESLAVAVEKLEGLPVRGDFSFKEPSDLESIWNAREAGSRKFPIIYGEGELLNRMYGAWLGRCAGCALGKPVEGFMDAHHGISSKDRIKKYLTAISPDEYPLRDYFPQHSPEEEEVGMLRCPLSTRENISFMESDDDIRYTVIGQIVLSRHGKNFSTDHVMSAWMNHLPYRFVCTAETQAYRNFVIRYQKHHPYKKEDLSVDWSWVATHQNPYREWIGAQIRADSWGYAAPGDPTLAAEFAWRDARMSHVKNGIYGEMFCAAMIAAAFATTNVEEVIEAGLLEIPRKSRLYDDILQTVEVCRKHGNNFDAFEKVFSEIYERLGHYSPVHTNNNAALVVAALLLGGRDFEKTITLAVMGGLDTDCNGATAGSILGTMLGAKQLPRKWIDPLHDTLYGEILGYHPIQISECAKRSLEIAGKIAKESRS